MSSSFCSYQNIENGKNIYPVSFKNNFSEKFPIKKCKNKISPNNKKLPKNNEEIFSKLISNLDKISSKDASKYIHCKRHPQNILSFFCETDKSFPCISCISQHQEHSYKQFFCSKKYFENETIKLKKLFGNIELKYFNNKKIAENFFSNIKAHFDKEIHKINDYFDSMISILQDKKSEFIAKMLLIYENYIKQFVKYKSIFDFCDKNFCNLNQKINYIENEIYKKGDFESFYNIKNIFLNEINNFSKYNDEYFYNKKIFEFNNKAMPFFIYPQKPIISITDNNSLFGSFKNSNLYFNKDENIDINNINISNSNNKMIEKIDLHDSIDNTLKPNNNNSLRKSNLDILLEKGKNIFSSINSGISNINESFIEKQLVDTSSTLFFLNKNDVKNVFKQQDLDVSQTLEKTESKVNNNKNINIIDSTKDIEKNSNNNLNKAKYTSCNKENRNKQIIKKFLENEELIKNDASQLTTKQSNMNKEQSTNYNSNNLEYFKTYNDVDNKCIINNNEKKIKNQKKNYLPFNKSKNNIRIYKRNCSTNNNINSSYIEINSHKNKSKITKINQSKKNFNNINGYSKDSFEKKSINNNNFSQNKYVHINKSFCSKKNRNNLIKNHIKNRCILALKKNSLKRHNNSMFNDRCNPGYQEGRITDNYKKGQRNGSSNSHLIRSNSYRLYKREDCFYI